MMTRELGIEGTAEAIVDTVREPLLLLDAELRVLKVNRSFCRIFETSAAETEGRGLSEIGDGQWDIPHLLELLQRVGAVDEAFEDHEVDHAFPRIGRRVMLLNARRLRREAGRPLLILLAIEDATRRRDTEALLQRQAEELARSNRDLEEFAYVASHDLQEPLRMVVSYTQLLAKRYQGKLGADADDFIGFAVDGAKRMQRLISDLLAYSRLDRPAPATEPADAGKALTDALSALAVSLAESGAKIEAKDLPSVRADYGQLTQLFQNLVGNALKFKSAEPLVVRVEAESVGGLWHFRVTDNGIGIDPQYFEKVFIIFERLHGAEVPGSGVGLALCRKIVQRHGGRIWLEQSPAGGTAVNFTFLAFNGAAS